METSTFSLCMSICSLWNIKLRTISSVCSITLSSVSGVNASVTVVVLPPVAMVTVEECGCRWDEVRMFTGELISSWSCRYLL